jgi:hypothetical protein
MVRLFPIALLLALLAACESVDHYRAQGIVGGFDVQELDLEIEPSLGTTATADRSVLPTVGGAWLVPYDETDSGIEWGLEAGFTIGAKWDSADLVIDGALVADNDYTLIDFFGGPYLSVPLAKRIRISVAGGPLVEWGRIELTFDPGGPERIDEEGVGYGLYARTGLDFDFGRGTWVGLGLRATDSVLFFDDAIEQLDIGGTQIYATMTFSY